MFSAYMHTLAMVVSHFNWLFPSFLQGMVTELCSGPCMVLEIHCTNAPQAFREFCGPADPVSPYSNLPLLWLYNITLKPLWNHTQDKPIWSHKALSTEISWSEAFGCKIKHVEDILQLLWGDLKLDSGKCKFQTGECSWLLWDKGFRAVPERDMKSNG